MKKIDHVINTKHPLTIIKTIHFILSKHCNGQKDKDDVKKSSKLCLLLPELTTLG